MTRFVGLLYSIILPGGVRVRNAPFRALVEELGYANPKALLASGNVVFDADTDDARGIEARFEPAFAARFGRQIEFIVRSAADWERLAVGNPFPEQSATDAANVAVRVMRAPLEPAAEALLHERVSEGEILQVVEGDPWVYVGAGISTSRLAGVMTNRRIGVGTSRNWNTVNRIADAL